MRKILIPILTAFVLILATGACAFADNTLKVGYQFNGLYNDGVESNTAVDPSITVGYEYTAKGENVEYGAGFEYQFDKNLKNIKTAQKFYFIPVYGMVNCILTENEYITARVGYNFFDGNSDYKSDPAHPGTLSGGIYYAAGAGVYYKNFRVEILYSCNNASCSNGGTTVDIKNTQWAVNFGIRF